jgi:tRNA pseudouridine38-40 synthase
MQFHDNNSHSSRWQFGSHMKGSLPKQFLFSKRKPIALYSFELTDDQGPCAGYKYQLTVAYDGTNYGGWQAQPNAVSIQSLIEQSLRTILRIPISVIGSGRTDAGVHALGQSAHFSTHSAIDTKKTLASLNHLLPAEIRILAIAPAPLDFHARYNAISKIYHYRLHLEKVPDPFKRHYAYHVPHSVDLDLLKEAASLLIGTHDFRSFANEANRGSAAKDAIRTLRRLDVIPEPGGVRLEFEGDGFLYKMVRNIVGTLLDVCSGKIAKDRIPVILAAKDRRVAGRTAPPHGLYLVEVNYQLTKDRDAKCFAPSEVHSLTCSF